MTRAVVIGGGLTGLSTAALLARGGLDVTLLEKHPLLGGRAAPVRSKGRLLDASPWPFSPDALSEYLALLGRSPDDYLEFQEPKIRCRAFFDEGLGTPVKAVDLSVDIPAIWDLLDSIGEGDGEGAHRLALAVSERHRLLHSRLSAVPYHGRRSFFHPPTVRHLPWLLTVLRRNVGKEIAQAVQSPNTARLLAHSALALTGSPATTPAAYAETCVLPLLGPVLHPRGGIGPAIGAIERVAREEGVEILLENQAARILVDPETRLATGVVSTTGVIIPADLVVSCVEPQHTETCLLTPEFRSFADSFWTHQTPSPSALVAAISVKKRVSQLAHHNLFFPKNWDRVLATLGSSPDDNPLSTEFAYLGRSTATDAAAAPQGKDSLVLVTPLPANPSLGKSEESRDSLARLVSRILSSIETTAGIPDLSARSTVVSMATPADLEGEFSAWRGSALGPAPTLGNLARPRVGNLSRRVRNLLYPGAPLLPGWGWSGAFSSAEVTAKVLLGLNDARPLPSPVEPGFLRGTTRTDAIGEALRVGT